MQGKIISTIFASVLVVLLSQNVYAESAYEEKLEFAEALEEMLGHFWALEKNIDEKNGELALVHASHPIAELYSVIKPELNEHDSELDLRLQNSLTDLPITVKSNPEKIQTSIQDIKGIIEEARTIVVGDELSGDISFQLDLIKSLIHTAEVEYEEAVSNGEIHEMAEYQDGSAFVWKSEQIFDSIKTELPEQKADEIGEFYEDLWMAIEQKADPTNVEVYIDGIIHEIDEIQGEVESEEDLLVYVENIENLLTSVKTEYQNGNTDTALSLATKAYLDNFEFLEGPLEESGNEELVHEIEIMMREDLREMIKNKAPSNEIDQHVDSILEKMESVKVAVPEFGSIVLIALALAIIGVVATSKVSRLSIIPRK
jgi:predicted secreted protein with PEFG-CTERM motif